MSTHTTDPATESTGAHWRLSVLVLLLLLPITLFFWLHQRNQAEADRLNDLERDATALNNTIQDSLRLHNQFLRSLRAFATLNEGQPLRAWREFGSHIEIREELSGLQVFAYAPRLAAAQQADFIARMQRGNHEAEFSIFPGTEAAQRFPVIFIQPDNSITGRTLGFDLYSDPGRQQAIDTAIDTGQTALTPPVELFYDRGTRRPGFLMVHPVYARGSNASTQEERRQTATGIVVTAYRADELLGNLIAANAERVQLRIQDISDGQPKLLYTSLEFNPASEHTQRQISFGGRTWQMDYTYSEHLGHNTGLDSPSLILLGGIATNLLIALLVYHLSSHRQRAESYARRLTTSLRRSEQDLRSSNQLMQSVLDAATEVSVIATDPRGVITVFNRGAEKLLGYEASEIVGHATPMLFHDADEVDKRSRALSENLGYTVTGFDTFITMPRLYGTERREWTYRSRQGKTISVDLVVTAQHDPEGRVTGYLGIAIDITSNKENERALRKQTSMLRSIIEHIPSGISVVDEHLRFIAANQMLREVLDLPASLFANGPPTFQEVALFNARRGDYGPGDPNMLAHQLVDKARHPTAHHFERTRPNGKSIEVRGTPLPEGGFITTYTDISERKAAEAELRQHRDKLQELVEERTHRLEEALKQARNAVRDKSEFLANMSHELRTPMHAILSFAELGNSKAQAAGNEKLIQYFARIAHSAERLLGLINDLLDLSKFEAGHFELHFQPTDLRAIVHNTVEELGSLLEPRQLRINTRMETACELSCDGKRIERVIHNLLANAIKFSPNGSDIGIEITADELPCGRRATDTARQPALRIAVHDCGVGIPEEELESIFDKFVQSSKTKTGAGGTGLGLSICREIIHAHRGTIAAFNNEDGGATFVVTLPVEQFTETETNA